MTYSPALVQRLFPSRTLLRECGILLLAVLMLALLARASVPFVPVPLTGQTLGVLLVGSLLGFRRGVAAVTLYLGAGILGLPVFALGMSGPAAFAGPTGGYLLGFVLSVGTAGLLSEHGFLRNLPIALLTMVLALLPTYALGLGWLASYVDPDRVLALGLWPFLPGEIVKVGLAALLTAKSVR